MEFHPLYRARGVENSSELYNDAEWNASSRFSAAQHIGRDTRVQPHALEPMELGEAVRLVPQVGGLCTDLAHVPAELIHRYDCAERK